MTAHSLLATHALPLWFLVLSLFLPRLCIAIAWFQQAMPAYLPSTVSLLQIVAALVVPRILILFWIYQDQGVGLWFLLHAIALVFAWGSGGNRVTRRRRRRTVEVGD